MKNRVLYLILSVAVSALLSVPEARSQHVATPASFEGYWVGAVENEKNYSIVILRVRDGLCSRYEKKDSKLVPVQADRNTTMLDGNNLYYSQIRNDGDKGEVLVYMMSYMKADCLHCVRIHQQTEAVEDPETAGINYERNTRMTGRLYRYGNEKEVIDWIVDYYESLWEEGMLEDYYY